MEYRCDNDIVCHQRLRMQLVIDYAKTKRETNSIAANNFPEEVEWMNDIHGLITLVAYLIGLDLE